MIKVGVADYGMMVWDGVLTDYEERLRLVRELGYDGLERIRPITGDDAIETAARVKKLGGDFATCLAPDIEHSIRWSAALGKEYVWLNVSSKDFVSFTRQVNIQTAACARYGIKAAYHYHPCPVVSNAAEFDRFMEASPEVGLILDTANHKNAGMDPFALLEKYYDRIVAIHLKDWLWSTEDPKKGRTCVLGQGNIDLDNLAFVRRLLEMGYDNKWVFVEPEHFQTDPRDELRQCREYVAQVGL